jgi:outer membrane protein W
MNRPEHIYNVSQTQLSVSRYYGGIKFNGADYHYDAESDTLTRMDVWKARIASSKEEGDKAAKAEREKWTKAQHGFAGF